MPGKELNMLNKFWNKKNTHTNTHGHQMKQKSVCLTDRKVATAHRRIIRHRTLKIGRTTASTHISEAGMGLEGMARYRGLEDSDRLLRRCFIIFTRARRHSFPLVFHERKAIKLGIRFLIDVYNFTRSVCKQVQVTLTKATKSNLNKLHTFTTDAVSIKHILYLMAVFLDGVGKLVTPGGPGM